MNEQISKRTMIWKEQHGAVGCSLCSWFYGTSDPGKTLNQAFSEHSCEEHPNRPTTGVGEDIQR